MLSSLLELKKDCADEADGSDRRSPGVVASVGDREKRLKGPPPLSCEERNVFFLKFQNFSYSLANSEHNVIIATYQLEAVVICKSTKFAREKENLGRNYREIIITLLTKLLSLSSSEVRLLRPLLFRLLLLPEP